MTILDASGRYLADMNEPAPRPAGPWSTNVAAGFVFHTAGAVTNPRAALRGADVREALAGEVPVRVAAAIQGLDDLEEMERIEREGRILRRLFNEDPVSAEELTELALGRRI